jgi:hypothetical protein
MYQGIFSPVFDVFLAFFPRAKTMPMVFNHKNQKVIQFSPNAGESRRLIMKHIAPFLSRSD